VKGKSDLEIAGIPRNIFLYDVLRICKQVKHWILCPFGLDWEVVVTLSVESNLRIAYSSKG